MAFIIHFFECPIQPIFTTAYNVQDTAIDVAKNIKVSMVQLLHSLRMQVSMLIWFLNEVPLLVFSSKSVVQCIHILESLVRNEKPAPLSHSYHPISK